MKIDPIVEILIDAEVNRKEIFKISNDVPELNTENAYDVQHRLVEKKLEEGKSVVGMKMGLTSRAKMEQMGIKEPLYGHLFDYMRVENDGHVSMSELIHPKVESEIAFIFKDDLCGAGLSDAVIAEAIAYAIPVMEIVDSRYENFNFTLPDVIADNCSSSRFIVGNPVSSVAGLAYEKMHVTLSINNELADEGYGSAVLGHPFASVRELASMLNKRGLCIKKGDIVLTGGITKAIAIKAGDLVFTSIEGLGDVRFEVKA